MPSPKDTKGPVVNSGPTRGKNRSRNKDGEWRKKRSDSGKSREKEKDSGCFITTAACAHRGLPDDCPELQVLRKFRDCVLLQTDAGAALVAEYYAIAPEIVAQLRDEAQYDFVWDSVKQCIDRIENYDHETAIQIYRKMVVSLMKLSES